jgi:hypothetical protein
MGDNYSLGVKRVVARKATRAEHKVLTNSEKWAICRYFRDSPSRTIVRSQR